jgi:hypothetical protein
MRLLLVIARATMLRIRTRVTSVSTEPHARLITALRGDTMSLKSCLGRLFICYRTAHQLVGAAAQGRRRRSASVRERRVQLGSGAADNGLRFLLGRLIVAFGSEPVANAEMGVDVAPRG